MNLDGRHHPADITDIGRADGRIALHIERHEEIGQRGIGLGQPDRMPDGRDFLR